MQLASFAMTASLAILLAGCGVSSSVESGGGDGTIEIRGQYVAANNTRKALEKDLAAEADRRCPSGWMKIGDAPNPYAMTGGRIWHIRCNTLATTSTTAPGVGPGEPPHAAAEPALDLVTQPAAPAGAPPDVSAVMRAAVMRAAPYLTPEAAQAIVEQQMKALAATKIRLVGSDGGPDGQPLPAAPAQR